MWLTLLGHVVEAQDNILKIMIGTKPKVKYIRIKADSKPLQAKKNSPVVLQIINE